MVPERKRSSTTLNLDTLALDGQLQPGAIYFDHERLKWCGAVSNTEYIDLSNYLDDFSIDVTKFVSGVTPIEIVDELPDPGKTGRIVFLTEDKKLYRDTGTEWTAAVPAVDITGTITATQIADGSISTPKLQANSITSEKIEALAITGRELAANSITGDKIVAGTIEAAKLAVSQLAAIAAYLGTVVGGTFKTNVSGYRAEMSSDGDFPIWYGTGAVTAANAKFYVDKSGNAYFKGSLGVGTVSKSGFDSSITPIEIVDTLPATGNTIGRIVFLSTDGKLHRYTASGWSSAVPAVDISGTLTASQIAVATLSAISANIGTVKTATSGYRTEISSENTYPIWYGTGDVTAANAKFYVDKSGAVYFNGTIGGGNVPSGGSIVMNSTTSPILLAKMQFKSDGDPCFEIGMSAIISRTLGISPLYPATFRLDFGTTNIWYTSIHAYASIFNIYGGLHFYPDMASSSDANTLDDYEEGSWTPSVRCPDSYSEGSYSYRIGKYTKIGNAVFIQCSIYVSYHDGTGAISISGLPFTSQNTSSFYQGITVGWSSNLALSSGNLLQAYINPNTTDITLWQVPSGGGAGTTVAMDSSFSIGLSGVYFV